MRVEGEGGGGGIREGRRGKGGQTSLAAKMHTSSSRRPGELLLCHRGVQAGTLVQLAAAKRDIRHERRHHALAAPHQWCRHLSPNTHALLIPQPPASR